MVLSGERMPFFMQHWRSKLFSHHNMMQKDPQKVVHWSDPPQRARVRARKSVGTSSLVRTVHHFKRTVVKCFQYPRRPGSCKHVEVVACAGQHYTNDETFFRTAFGVRIPKAALTAFTRWRHSSWAGPPWSGSPLQCVMDFFWNNLLHSHRPLLW